MHKNEEISEAKTSRNAEEVKERAEATKKVVETKTRGLVTNTQLTNVLDTKADTTYVDEKIELYKQN